MMIIVFEKKNRSSALSKAISVYEVIRKFKCLISLLLHRIFWSHCWINLWAIDGIPNINFNDFLSWMFSVTLSTNCSGCSAYTFPTRRNLVP